MDERPDLESCAIHDRAQIAAILEHLEAAHEDLTLAHAALAYTGIPIEVDDEVPRGTIRLRFADGGTRDIRLV